jgi:hypothetical protein
MGSSRLWPYTTADELAKETLSMEGWIGVKVAIPKKPDMAKIAPLMARTKKPAELYATYDGKKLVIEVRVGTAYKQVLGTLDLAAEKDLEKRRDLLKKINAKDKKLVTDQELGKFEMAHPTPDQKNFAQRQLVTLRPEIEKLKARQAHLKSLTYDKCGSEELAKQFQEWVENKHWGHYLEFLREVDAGADSKKIFDTFIGDGQQAVAKPVNLDAATARKIQKDLAAGKVPDFTAARAQIVKMVDAKFVPAFKKEALAKVEDELKWKEKRLAEYTETVNLN